MINQTSESLLGLMELALGSTNFIGKGGLTVNKCLGYFYPREYGSALEGSYVHLLEDVHVCRNATRCITIINPVLESAMVRP